MKQNNFKEFLFFICGFLLGNLIVFFMTLSIKEISLEKSLNKRVKVTKVTDEPLTISSETLESDSIFELYDEKLAEKLFNEVKILCWVFTHPDNHKKKVPYVRQTWGRRCNKLLFMSTETDPEQPDIIAIPVENGRAHLWNKTRLAMKYVYENYINDYDWFMRADDDMYIIMENLRYKLSKYRTQTAIYIGNRYAYDVYDKFEEGFMAGGGQIFSKKVLTKFVTYLAFNESICQQNDSDLDDVLTGQCLRKHVIFIDARDEKNQKQIFPIGVKIHMQHLNKPPDMNFWYWNKLWRNVTQGGLDCCSDVYIGMAQMTSKEIILLEFLINHLHPFGLEKNLTETLPRKLSLDEIIADSDAKSIWSPLYREHEKIHFLDDDEKY